LGKGELPPTSLKLIGGSSFLGLLATVVKKTGDGQKKQVAGRGGQGKRVKKEKGTRISIKRYC